MITEWIGKVNDGLLLFVPCFTNFREIFRLQWQAFLCEQNYIYHRLGWYCGTSKLISILLGLHLLYMFFPLFELFLSRDVIYGK